MIKKIIFFILVCNLNSACEQKVKVEFVDSSSACPSSESFVDNSLTYNNAANKKMALRFGGHMRMKNGTYVGILLSKVRLYLSTNNLTQVQLDLYKGSSSGPPDGGTLVGTSVISSGLGASDPLTPIDFDFSPALATLLDGGYYWLVLTPTGGTYSIMVTSDNLISGAHIASYSGGSWSYGVEYASHLSTEFTYSGCTNW